MRQADTAMYNPNLLDQSNYLQVTNQAKLVQMYSSSNKNSKQRSRRHELQAIVRHSHSTGKIGIYLCVWGWSRQLLDPT